MQDLLATTERFIAANVISRKELRSCAGCVSHVCNLLWAWRPFTDELWAAVESPGRMKSAFVDKRGKRRKRPANCIWTYQVFRTLTWIRSFLRSEQGSISRTWVLAHYLSEYSDLVFLFDACPWGLGGILVEEGVLVSYYIS